MLEEYRLSGSSIRYVDTMSLHMATSGLSTQQLPSWRKAKADAAKEALDAEERDRKSSGSAEASTGGTGSSIGSGAKPAAPAAPAGGAGGTKGGEMKRLNHAWMGQGSPPSLKNCYKLWCNGELEKEDRNIFVDGEMMDIQMDFNNLMTYCAKDCAATYAVFAKAFDHFSTMCPHPVTSAGMFEMGTSYLPINEDWPYFIDRAQMAYDDRHVEVSDIVGRRAHDLASRVGDEQYWREDPWYRHLDWSFEPQKYSGPRFKQDGWWAKGGAVKTIPGQKHVGKPAWYRSVLVEIDEVGMDADDHYWPDVSDGMQVTPYLYKLEWVDKDATSNEETGEHPAYTLYLHEEHKWGYLVPIYDELAAINAARTATAAGVTGNGKANANANTKGEPVLTQHAGNGPYEWEDPVGSMHLTHEYFKLPCAAGRDATCGTPFAKEYLRFIESGQLRSADPVLNSALGSAPICSYWKSNRSRVQQQFVVWEHLLDKRGAPGMRTLDGNTTSDLEKEFANDPGGRPLMQGAILPPICVSGTVTRRSVEKTWMTASNPKITRIGSELKAMVKAPPGHSFVGADVDSQELWIAAVLGDAYFAQSHGATALGWMTLQGSKSDGTDMHSASANVMGVSRDEAKILNYARIYGAAQSFAERLLIEFNPKMPQAIARQKAAALYEATKGKEILSVDDSGGFRSRKRLWVGGTESNMFNRLEEIAFEDTPRTPVLGCQISAALQPRFMGTDKKQYLRSRINWAVQSSAVDYLHIMLVAMKHMCEEHDINARYCISIHDEVRYIVADEDVDRAAYALQLANLMTRAFFAHQLQIYDLPQGVAFFSAVDIDHVVRKEVNMHCITPSNHIPIPPGRSMDIHEIGERVQWSLEKKS